MKLIFRVSLESESGLLFRKNFANFFSNINALNYPYILQFYNYPYYFLLKT